MGTGKLSALDDQQAVCPGGENPNKEIPSTKIKGTCLLLMQYRSHNGFYMMQASP